MNKNTDNEAEHEYISRDIFRFESTDPRGNVPDSKVCTMSEALAIEKNYAYALNGHPYRLIKLESEGLRRHSLLLLLM